MENERVPQIDSEEKSSDPPPSSGSALHKRKRSDGWLQSLMCGSRKHRRNSRHLRCFSCQGGASSFNDTTDADKTNPLPRLKSSTVEFPMFESFTVIMKRSPTGYGFGLAGSSPAFISSVEQGSAAAVAGLQEGDCIIRYNGQNVSRLSGKDIKSIVMRSRQSRIILDIQRGDSRSADDEDKENNGCAARTDLRAVQSRGSPAGPTAATPGNLSGSSSYAALKGGKDSSFTDALTHFSAQLSDDNYTYDFDDEPQSDAADPSDPEKTPQTSTLQQTEHQAAVKKLLNLERHFARSMSLCVQQYSRPLRHCIISAKQHQTLFQNIEKLVAVTEFHVRQLDENRAVTSVVETESASTAPVERTVGATYLPRIRFLCESYAKYTQGLGAAKKMLAELRGYPEFNIFLQSNDEVLTEMSIDDFLGAPCSYLRSLHEHLKLVAANTPSQHQDHFPIHQVLHEMNSAMLRLYQIKNKLSKKQHSKVSLASGSSGYSGSSGMTRSSTRSALSTITKHSGKSKCRSEAYPKTSDHTGSSGFSRPADQSFESTFFSKLAPDETLAWGGGSNALVDALSFQQRLIFPTHLKRWKFTPHMRHLVYSGNLMLKFPDAQWMTVYAALFSELLILTRPNLNGKLDVVQEPLPLSEVTHLSFLSSHPSEFKVRSLVKEKSLELRAKTLEQKCVWKNLLEQRLTTVRNAALEQLHERRTRSKLSQNRL